jgi:flagellar basal-body rod protein FlgC
MANAETTHTDQGGPYVRKEVVFGATGGSLFHSLTVGGCPRPAGSVRLTQVVDDPTPPVMHYEPGNPDADASGYVSYPAINPVKEMVDLMGSVRAYQLNASAISAEKQMSRGIDRSILKSS